MQGKNRESPDDAGACNLSGEDPPPKYRRERIKAPSRKLNGGSKPEAAKPADDKNDQPLHGHSRM